MAKLRYSPATVPQAPGQLSRYLDRELRKLSDFLTGNIPELYPGPVLALLAQSNAFQQPDGTGAVNAIGIRFGNAQKGPNDPVQLFSDGAIVFNQTGTYSIDTRYSFQRSGNPGSAYLFVRALLNGMQQGNPIAVRLNEPGYSAYEQFTIVGNIVAGTQLVWQLARDASGANDGYLSPIASTLGWGDTPSALVRILKF